MLQLTQRVKLILETCSTAVQADRHTGRSSTGDRFSHRKTQVRPAPGAFKSHFGQQSDLVLA